jgi:protein arginine kinase
MTIDNFAGIEPSWLSSDETDIQNDPITILSNVKIRRNLKDYPFPAACGKSQLFDVAALLLGTIGRSDEWMSCDFRMIDSLDSLSKGMLVETKTVTRAFASGGAGRFLLRDDEGTTACMINEDDHLCVSVVRPGLTLQEAAKTASAFSDAVTLETASDPVLGILTANPNYAGSGMQAFTMLHMPALDASGEIERVSAAFQRDWGRVSMYKLLSDKNNASGSFFLVTNRVTLAVTPDEIVELVTDAAHSLASKEMFARHKIMNTKNGDMNDRFWRAWGLLRYARKLTFPEAISKASFIKLGSDLGVLPKLDERAWRRLVVGAQHHHLSAAGKRIVESSEEPFIRASMFRQFIERAGAKTLPCTSDYNKELQK